jgi:hypothetical protein
MVISLMFLLQSAATTDAGETKSGKLQIPMDRCDPRRAATDEVVVCGRRDSKSLYRVGPQSELPPAIPNAEFRLLDGVGLKLHAEEGEVGGIPTNRAMVSLKIKF